MSDPRIEFLSSLTLDRVRIKDFPGFIFLCGGPVPPPWGSAPPPAPGAPVQHLSLRHHLLDHITSNGIELGAPIVVAETFSKWLEFDTYNDLITFERHLAGVANVIPIIVESPGAIAELGAFSQENSIKEKLFVFRREKFADEQSFINFGLLKFVAEADEERVQTYPWLVASEAAPGTENQIGTTNAPIVSDVANHIAERVKENAQKSHKFQKENPGDVMILIEDLIKLMIGLKITEIVTFLTKIGIEIEQKTVAQYLFLLRNLNIVGEKHYGSRFYFSKQIWKTHVEYAFKDGVAPFDRAAFMERLEGNYKEQKDKRLNASRAFAADLGGGS